MIAYLNGKVRSKREQYLVIEVQGVGYKVFVPKSVWEKTETHLPTELHIHTIVREDEISLYGFEKEEELKLFEMFLTINGVGPRLALDLFTWPIEKLKKAILSKDVTAITEIKGIGKKTAERIILELKEKLGGTGGDNLPDLENESARVTDEVLDALLSLGYQRRDIKRILGGIKDPLKNSEETIKYFLKHV